MPFARRIDSGQTAGPGHPCQGGAATRCVSPGICGKPSSDQRRAAAAMRSRSVATKFHHMRTGRSSGAPPTTNTRAPCAPPSSSAPQAFGQHDQLLRRQGLAVNVQAVLGAVECHLGGQRGQRPCSASGQLDVEVQGGRRGSHRTARAKNLADQHPDPHAARQRELGQVGGGHMLEAGLDLFERRRQCHPQLQAMQAARLAALVVGHALAVHDAPACGHPVDGPGPDGLHRAHRFPASPLL